MNKSQRKIRNRIEKSSAISTANIYEIYENIFPTSWAFDFIIQTVDILVFYYIYEN